MQLATHFSFELVLTALGLMVGLISLFRGRGGPKPPSPPKAKTLTVSWRSK